MVISIFPDNVLWDLSFSKELLCVTFNTLYVNCKLMVRLDQIDLSKEGLNKFFSPIETRIMKTLWSEGEMTTTMLTEKTNIPLTSVAGTLDRLVKAGYAARHSETIKGRIKYFYEPIFSEKEIAIKITNSILDRLVDTFGPLAIENFSKYSGKKII